MAGPTGAAPTVPGVPGGAARPGAAPGQPGAAVVAQKPRSRPDPFKPWWTVKPPPPPNVLTFTEPVRIARFDTAEPDKQQGVEIKEVPNRRVAGILSGNGIYALVEGPEGQTVVKPGDPLGDYRVDSIRDDSVVLKRTEKIGNLTRTYTQVVPLTDQGATTRFSGPAPGAPGGPGMAMPGRPSVPRRGGGKIDDGGEGLE